MPVENNPHVRHGDFEFRPHKDEGKKHSQRLGMHHHANQMTNQKQVDSIAYKSFTPGRFREIKEKIMTLFSWKWIKFGEGIINIKSAAKTLGVTPKEIKTMHKTGMLAKEMVLKLTKKAVAADQETFKTQATRITKEHLRDSMCRLDFDKHGFSEALVLWDPETQHIRLGSKEKELYMQRDELKDKYIFQAKVCKMEGQYYIRCSDGTHIAAREQRGDLLATYSHDTPQEEINNQRDEMLKHF